MECNKEEAVRAKDIAEKKLRDKDFLGARKFAQKAQQLFPEIDNITQLICVCDVHCSSVNKVNGNEMDWYSILQIGQTADDTLIKKQYRKFALLLHPDKNKFAGAEAAFKLIGEAQRVLLDKEKRSVYDMKRRSLSRPAIPHQPPQQPPQQSNRSFGAAKQFQATNSFTSNPYSHVKVSNPPKQEPRQQAQPRVSNQRKQEPRQQAQSRVPNGKETFWTQCPGCHVRYQYYKEVLARALRCQSCKKPFFAFDSGEEPEPSASQPVFRQQNIPSASKTRDEKPVPSGGFQPGQTAEVNGSQKARQSQMGPNKEDRPNSSRKVNGSRAKKPAESSESFESDSSSGLEDVEIHVDGDHHTRRSNRNKRHVSYNEPASDDDEITTPSKKPRNASCSATEEKIDLSDISGSAFVKDSRKGECSQADGNETVAGPSKKNVEADNGFSSSPESDIPTFHEYPDPEFSDFDKSREEHCFKVGQVWAAYDTADAMPRFYARIKKISPGFKLQITWFEPDPDDEVGIEWIKPELPYSCGKFKKGNSEDTEDRLMFSHVVSMCKASGRSSFTLYPIKGEIWALFKNWSVKWCSIPEGVRKFEYDFVEVLSNYDESVGIRARPLAKLKGFASLFCQISNDEICIPPTEILRFSHLVPSCRMTGAERVDVPKGSFELDPAAITMNLEEVTLPQPDKRNCINELHSECAAEEKPAPNIVGISAPTSANNEKRSEVDLGNILKDNVTRIEVPDPEFHNFDAMKAVDKFRVNQVWAFYSDVDGLPTYYGFVKKIDPHPDFKVHIAWLNAFVLPAEMILWKEKAIPISCGQFRIKGNKVQIYEDTVAFSHQVHAEPTFRKNEFAIYPRKGEIWALHKKWNPDMKLSELKDCDYDIVEVLVENDASIKVVVLERVHGFTSVYRPLKNGSSHVMQEIPRAQLLRFSHQIPQYLLKDENGGSLKGCWELDPAALPVNIWHKSK